MADFVPALRKTLRHEGVQFNAAGQPVPGHIGFADHPDDTGGATAYGITLAEARKNGHVGPMQELPFALAVSIYRRKYWERVRGDEIADQSIAEELFDTAVNCGIATTIIFLQRALNALNGKARDRWPTVVVDGGMGQATLGALSAAVKAGDRLQVLRAVDSLQCVRYIELGEQNDRYRSFVRGWLGNRVGVKD